LAYAWVHGVEVDWRVCFPAGSRTVELPTYPFQHQRFWPEPAVVARSGDVTGAGLLELSHPILGAGVAVAGSDTQLFTANVSLAAHPWLAEHALLGTVVVPGAALAEIAVRAADQVGCSHVAELTLQAPLVVPASGGRAVQVRVDEPAPDGSRELRIFSRDGDEAPWQQHATGLLATGETLPDANFGALAGEWPPSGAQTVETAGLYEDFAAAGYHYGPAFRGLTAAWRRGDEVFAEVALPEAQHRLAEAFGIHPALLDAALHASWLDAARDRDTGVAMPFSWTGVRLHSTAATTVRVRLAPSGDGGTQVLLADPAGLPVATVDSLAVRELPDPAALVSRVDDALFALDWPEVPPGPAENDPPPVVRFEATAGDPAAAVHTAVRWALDTVRERLDRDESDERPLVIVTMGAVATADDDRPDLAGAAVQGVVRTAQAEHPGRFVLADIDGTDASEALLAAATSLGEPQFALRDGAIRVPRLVRAGNPPTTGRRTRPEGAGETGSPVAQDGAGGTPRPPAPGSPWQPEDTVLVTGAGGVLGRALSRHLVERHGVRHLLLLGRQGAATPEARELVGELTGLGAEVTFAACDVADRERLAEVLAAVPAGHPLTGVVHCAGIIDDAPVTAQTGDQADRVLRPKVDGALHLHELTRTAPLTAFVLCSSASGTTGSPGQAGYTAANAVLDALAVRRRAEGLPAQSLGWGLWAARGAMTAGLGDAHLSRGRRDGVVELSGADGLALFDAALARPGRALLLPIRLDLRQVDPAKVPPLLRGLVRVPARRIAASAAAPADVTAGLRQRLSTLDEKGAVLYLEDLVRAEVAGVLGHAGPGSVDPARAFGETGFDSITAVELRNRVGGATGLRLPPTLIFDHPTPAAVAAHLLVRLAPEPVAGGSAETGEAAVHDLLRTLSVERLRGAGLLDALVRLAGSGPAEPREPGRRRDLSGLDADELVRMALGGPAAGGE
jgi:acyl transferase domain-containing protein